MMTRRPRGWPRTADRGPLDQVDGLVVQMTTQRLSRLNAWRAGHPSTMDIEEGPGEQAQPGAFSVLTDHHNLQD